MTLFTEVVDLFREAKGPDIAVFGGGIIPDADIKPLLDRGVAAVFTRGTSTQEIVEWVTTRVRPEHDAHT